jgi:hypothetical protein
VSILGLPYSQQKAILEDLLTDIPVHFDFLFSDSHAEVISGKQEGWYLDLQFEMLFLYVLPVGSSVQYLKLLSILNF